MFELARPWALALMLLPPLLYALPPLALKLQNALHLPFYNQLQVYLKKSKATWSLFSLSHFLYFLMVWFLLLLAFAGPRWVGAPMPLTQEGRNLMLVLDLSESMALDDMVLAGQNFPRLTVVKATAQQFVQQRKGDKIGLIVFGSRAYLQTPLTFDNSAILDRLKDAAVGLAGNSTSLGDALGLAVKHLQNVPKKSRVIVLLTDGANNTGILSPSKAAQLAKDDGIKVYTIGLGSDMGAFLNLGQAAQLDEKTLKEIAEKTGGRYFRATDPQSLEVIYQTIDQLEKTKGEAAFIRPQKEYYVWPLLAGFALFLAWFFMKTHWRKARPL